MNKDSQTVESIPAAISELYREVATETAPDALDESVLNDARRAARSRSADTWSWYKPAIFVGLFGLSLALLLEFSELAGIGAESGTERITEVSNGTESLLVPKSACTDEERKDAASWWACIQELEAGGHAGAAEEELKSLLAAFPGFESRKPAEH